MKKLNWICGICIMMLHLHLSAQTPLEYSWVRNLTGATGLTQNVSNGIPSNVTNVQTTASDVYITCASMPGYSIGPWNANPNSPSNQNFVFKITKNPVQNTGTKTYTALGQIGVWSNGVAVFNPQDGKYWDNTTMSFKNGNTNNGWNRNAYYYEGVSFDNCLGHPAPSGCYHNHVHPKCLYDATDTSRHSPIIGYAFDGFPIYGAYAYTNTNGTGAIKRMKPSYVLAQGGSRTNGPPVNTTYPRGCMNEDYVYTPGAGDLDEYNGRFCITPEYPAGIYCYFATIDSLGNAAYPYVIGPQYYGTVASGNTGPMGGKNTVPGGATVFTGYFQPSIAITVSKDSVKMGDSVTCYANTTHEGTGPKYQWRKNNAVVASTNNASYTYSNVTTNDTLSCTLVSNKYYIVSNNILSNKVILKAASTNTSSINGIDKFQAFQLYPNPTTGNMHVNFNAAESNEMTYIRIIDLQHRIVYQLSLQPQQVIAETMDVSHLQDGTYILMVQQGQHVQIDKFVLIK